MEWFVFLFLGFFLLFFPKMFSKIGWFNLDNMDGNEGTWEKDDKKSSTSKKVLFVYKAIGFVFIVFSLARLLSELN
ncbi:hypothetical protein [Paenibacillus agaridevorans]|nr:hypothetical protein [Paenibacillus agaridevorans]